MPPEPRFTFGIEEEYHLVDCQSRDLASAPQEMLDLGLSRLGDRVSPEFLRSQIEIGTQPHTSFSAARLELGGLRGEIVRLAGEHGLAPMLRDAPVRQLGSVGDQPESTPSALADLVSADGW
ncbi:MAG: glutamate-cysteine ligase family protein [Hyphomicrobiaceae bacterium]